MGLSVDILYSELLISAEEKRDAPYCRDSYKNVDGTAEDASCAAEKPCYHIKLEYTDQSPVYSSDYQKNKSNFVPHTENTS